MGAPVRGRADYWSAGDWNATCGQCGRKRKASEMRILPPGVPGAGLRVCYPEHWDYRHPQEFVRAVPDLMTAPWAQPPVDVNVFSIACTTGGTADALVLTPTVTIGGPYFGQIFEFTAASTNTGATTATILGATEAVLLDYTALVAGDIVAGTVYTLTYLQDLSTQDSYFALNNV